MANSRQVKNTNDIQYVYDNFKVTSKIPLNLSALIYFNVPHVTEPFPGHLPFSWPLQYALNTAVCVSFLDHNSVLSFSV